MNAPLNPLHTGRTFFHGTVITEQRHPGGVGKDDDEIIIETGGDIREI
jgi:hypothetical protein